MTELLENLNDEQLGAVTSTEGYIRVVAGAGSGKTRALSSRFAYLVNEVGILPGNILCVTFTNKAANEMRQRIHALTGDNDTGFVCTFHSFCVSILQEDSHAVGYPRSFLVLDNADIDSMLSVIYEERGLTLRDMTFSKARDMIEMIKLFERPDYYIDLLSLSADELRQKCHDATTAKDIIFYGYLWQERKCFGFDYNDLLKVTLHIFENNEDIRLKWQKRLEYIMIDEFQDIDLIQYRLMEVLCGYHQNLFIVGDPDQTIYTWRGADIRFLLDFDKHFPDVKTIMMMKNYRSTPQIINAANSLIEKNVTRMKKDLFPTLADGQRVLYSHSEDSLQECNSMIKKMLALHDSGVSYSDMTVLYRAHYVTRSVEDALRAEQIPYRIYSGVPFFGRSEIKDALSYLRMIAYRDDLSFLRIVNNPKRNIGKRRMKFLSEYSEQNECSLYQALLDNLDDELFKNTKAGEFVHLIERLSEGCEEVFVSELLKEVLEKSGYEKMLRTEGDQERLDNLAELLQSVYEYENNIGEESSLSHYLSHVALFTNQDADVSGERVRLMTVHAAKGLEFSYVFLCAMNEGIFPSKRTDSLPAMEEERRLAFVAMTRAMRGLYISESQGRNLDGSPRFPSRFVLDIDEDFLEYENKPDDSLLNDALDSVKLSSKYLRSEREISYAEIGSRVSHPILGEGTVLEILFEKNAYQIQFDGMDTPRKISFKAKLTPL